VKLEDFSPLLVF